MPNTKTISIKVPIRILEHLPAPGNGRSGFILQAIEDKIARREPVKWRPRTARGRRMAALLNEGRKERLPLLSDRQIEEELSERRGRKF